MVGVVKRYICTFFLFSGENTARREVRLKICFGAVLNQRISLVSAALVTTDYVQSQYSDHDLATPYSLKVSASSGV